MVRIRRNQRRVTNARPPRDHWTIGPRNRAEKVRKERDRPENNHQEHRPDEKRHRHEDTYSAIMASREHGGSRKLIGENEVGNVIPVPFADRRAVATHHVLRIVHRIRRVRRRRRESIPSRTADIRAESRKKPRKERDDPIGVRDICSSALDAGDSVCVSSHRCCSPWFVPWPPSALRRKWMMLPGAIPPCSHRASHSEAVPATARPSRSRRQVEGPSPRPPADSERDRAASEYAMQPDSSSGCAAQQATAQWFGAGH
jgi:hypothetical protein